MAKDGLSPEEHQTHLATIIMSVPNTIRRSQVAGRATTQLAQYLESPDLCPEAVVIDLSAEHTSRFSASYLMRLIAEELNRRGQQKK